MLEVLEEVALRVDDERVPPILEDIGVGVGAAVELVELGVAVEGGGIDLGRLRIALAAQFLGLPIGFRTDDHHLSIRICGDAECQLAPGGAILTSLDLALGVHAFIHRHGHFRRQVDLLYAHIDDVDAHFAAHHRVEVAGEFLHELVPLAGDDLVHVATADLVAQALVDPFLQEVASAGLVAGARGVVTLHVAHLPLGEHVHHQGLFLQRVVARRRRVEGQHPTVEFAHVLGDGHLDVQARLDVGALDGTEAQQQCPLGLVDGEHGVADEHGTEHEHDHGNDHLHVHQLLPSGWLCMAAPTLITGSLSAGPPASPRFRATPGRRFRRRSGRRPRPAT